jgi:hypothetical protein
MSTKRKTALQRMDALVRWSGASRQVRLDMSREPRERRRRTMRWLPLVPIAVGAGLMAAAIAHPVSGASYGVGGPVIALAAGMMLNGPLGKSSRDDDEREALLRKNAYLFCLAILAFANIVGGPALLLAATSHAWTGERCVGVAFAWFLANMTWFTSLPTLYASWRLPRHPDSES